MDETHSDNQQSHINESSQQITSTTTTISMT